MMAKFRAGDVILLDGLYECAAESCEVKAWGIPGRRFQPPGCGHEEWRLVRRRIDAGF
jgi:hypothetical protein